MMNTIDAIIDDGHDKLFNLIKDLPSKVSLVVTREYYNGYAEHKRQYGSLRPILEEDAALYCQLMQKRLDFMYDLAERKALEMQQDGQEE